MYYFLLKKKNITLLYMKDYIIIDKFLSNKDIDEFKTKITTNYNKNQGKFGDKVLINSKRRFEYYPNENDLIFIDEKMEHLRNKVYEDFNYFVVFREKWKVGYYDSIDSGFYTAHRDNQHKVQHRRVSCICMLSSPHEYEGGELHFPELKKNFKMDKGSLIIFNSNLLHGVKPVTKGQRYVILSFYFDVEFSAKRKDFNWRCGFNKCLKHNYLLPITPNSGPGNQIISIKEALILSKLLNRICILPPIHAHYTTKVKKFWNFEEIFSYKHYLTCYYDFKNEYKFDNIYGTHGRYTFENLKLEKHLNIKDKKIHLLDTRRFKNIHDIEELKKKEDHILCIKHLFNHVYINECPLNGCSRCDYNKNFYEIYKAICKTLDFSPKIKKIGDNYVKQRLNNKYISIHIRYPDSMPKENTFKNYLKYDEEDIYLYIEKLKKEKNIDHVFIASNNVSILNKTSLKNYNTYDIDTTNPINSFIEQYICCRSDVFILSRYNDFREEKVDNYHIRSTWSSFVIDYRIFNQNNNNNIYIDSVL